MRLKVTCFVEIPEHIPVLRLQEMLALREIHRVTASGKDWDICVKELSLTVEETKVPAK